MTGSSGGIGTGLLGVDLGFGVGKVDVTVKGALCRYVRPFKTFSPSASVFPLIKNC